MHRTRPAAPRPRQAKSQRHGSSRPANHRRRMCRLQPLRTGLSRARLHHNGGSPHRPTADVVEAKNCPRESVKRAQIRHVRQCHVKRPPIISQRQLDHFRRPHIAHRPGSRRHHPRLHKQISALKIRSLRLQIRRKHVVSDLSSDVQRQKPPAQLHKHQVRFLLFFRLINVPLQRRLVLKFQLRAPHRFPEEPPVVGRASEKISRVGASPRASAERDRANRCNDAHREAIQSKIRPRPEISHARPATWKVHSHFTRTCFAEITTNPLARPCSTTSRKIATSCSQYSATRSFCPARHHFTASSPSPLFAVPSVSFANWSSFTRCPSCLCSNS